MAYNYEYPYTDPNRYNDDWLVTTVRLLSDKVDRVMGERMSDAIKEYFNTLMPVAIYDEAKERITLRFVPQVGEATHKYDPETHSLVVDSVADVTPSKGDTVHKFDAATNTFIIEEGNHGEY